MRRSLLTHRATQRPELSPLRRSLLLGIAVSSVVAATSIRGGVAAVVVLVGAGLGWWFVPGFWRSVLAGAIGGVAAGLLVLGPGLRLAMRVVAIVDPVRTPELTLEGTMFVVIFVGGLFGAILGTTGNLARRGLGLRSELRSALFPATALLVLLLAVEDLRTELFELGVGAWMNIPMFGVVGLLFGAAAMAAAIRLEERRTSKLSDGEEVSPLPTNAGGARR